MQKVVYIDSIFFVNFMMDMMLLYLTGKTICGKISFRRLLLGSLIGAGGYCLILCLSFFFCREELILGMFPLAFLMVKAGCRVTGVKGVLRGVGYVFTYAFLIGGVMLFLLKQFPFLRKNRESILVILAAGCFGFFLCRELLIHIKRKKQNVFYRVFLNGDERELQILGLIDTGNGLTDPVSGQPVAIMEETVWNEMQKEKRPEKYKVIPFHSIGKKRGILEGYEVERIEIECESEKKELTNVTIAVFQGKLSVKGDYQIILPPQWSF